MATQPPTESFLAKFLNEEQNPEIVERVYGRVQQILTSGEEISYIAVQKKTLDMIGNLSPDCVVLTNKRFIIYRPKLLGRVDFEDYIWRDLRDVRLKEGIIGATLSFQTVKGRTILVESLPKAQARRIYSVAQEMEEAMLEERRAREMEEKRAAAGGIVLQTGMPVANPAPAVQDDPVEKLKKLKAMQEAGLITEAEYEGKKAEILAQM
ncbi:MAG: PH domain-containing protein [Anaerolineae bacterium]|nr:PH domain-containing protein [Anaerolineae bacterium]